MKKILTLSFFIFHFSFYNSAQAQQPGDLDLTFDTDGIVTTDINNAGTDDGAGGVAIQSDGKIIVAGYSGDFPSDFSAARYNPDGSLDNTFSTDGKVTTDFGVANDQGTAVAIQSDGKIVVVGYAWNGSNYDFGIVRYTTNGSLDNSFSSDGMLMTDFNGLANYATAVAIQPDGKIVVAGTRGNSIDDDIDFAVARYNSDGTLDNSFDSDGKQTVDILNDDDVASEVLIQSDGKIVLVGDEGNVAERDLAVVRLNSNGTLDNSFSGDGIAVEDFNSSFDYGKAAALQPDGKILAGGDISFGGDSTDFSIARFNSNGSLDNSFGTNGWVRTDYDANWNEIHSLTMQPDGKIVAAGYYNNEIDIFDSDYDYAVLRYNSDGSLDNSFGTNGIVTTAVGVGVVMDDVIESVVMQPDGKILAAGRSWMTGHYDISMARYLSGLVIGVDAPTIPENDFVIYPNPADQSAVINLQLAAEKNCDLKVFDLMGKEIYAASFTNDCSLLTDNWSSGVYFVQLKSENKTATQKLIIRH